MLAPGSVLEFAHPIVRTAVYESIPPGERALAHAEAARLLERDGAQAELFQNAVISADTVAEAVTLPRRTGRSAAWAINDALLAATSQASAGRRVRVAQHRPDEALADLLAAGEGWQALGITNPAVASWRTAAVAAYRALGQHDEAAALAAEQLALARKAGSPLTLGIALRVHGDLAEAIGVLEASPARYELALALADHGASLRRSGQRTQARQPLLRALDLAERTGAAGLAAEVKRELLAAGARPRRAALTGPDALTAGERRVAALAADGASNRQIAEHLFITQATVETHLRHAFRKLNITSRADLPASLNG